MRTEDDLRAAFLVRSERHAPEAARVLPGAQSRRRAGRSRVQGGIASLEGRGWITWAAPVAAAAVVAALGISLAATRHAPVEGTASVPVTSPGISATLPEYYAALDNPAGPIAETTSGQHQTPVSIRIGDDRTGKIIATVNAPAGETFAGLTGAADDRTFVAAAERFPVKPLYPAASPVAWYLFRLTPGSAHPVTLTPLPIPGEPAGSQVSAIALSPNGTELAVMSQANVWFGKTGPLTVALYSLTRGKPVRTWTVDPKSLAVPGDGLSVGFGWYWGRYSNTALTWLAGGRTLAVTYGFNSYAPSGSTQSAYAFAKVTIRTVDAGSPSGDLLTRSKLVFRLPKAPSNGATDCDSVQLTDDGETVLCGKYAEDFRPSTADAPKIVAYSVATGRPRLLYQLKGAYAIGLADILWASPTGSTLLGALDAHTTLPEPDSPPGKAGQAAGLITKGAFNPVRFPLSAVPFAGEIAF